MFEKIKNLFTQKSVETLNLNDAVRSQCEVIRPSLGNPYTIQNSVENYRSWVYAASSKNAETVSNSRLKLYSFVPSKSNSRKMRQNEMAKVQKALDIHELPVEEVLESPILDLLRRPNPEDSQSSFLFKTDLFLELTGDAFILIERNQFGMPSALWVLFSQYVHIQHDGMGNVQYYNYGIPHKGNFNYQYLPEDIIHVRLFDPSSPYRGISPLKACSRGAGLIESMTTYEEALNRNMGVPTSVIKYKDVKISEDQKIEFEKKWNKKFSSVGRAGKIAVTDKDIEIDAIGIVPRDMQFMHGRKWSREEIFACFQIPQALVITEGVNRANMERAEITYINGVVKSRLRLITQTITRQLVDRNSITPGMMVVGFEDLSPEDFEKTVETVKILIDAEAISKKELREIFGIKGEM